MNEGEAGRTVMQIGEAFVGSGVNAAHVNSVLGERDGPVGTAWATALATPSTGHAPFVAIGRPSIAVVPPTLFVNKAAITSDRHGILTWGAAQAGVAKGVATALEEGVIDLARCSDLVIIAAVWVDPEADDAKGIFVNNAEATCQALRNGKLALPSPADSIAAAIEPFNPFFSARSTSGEDA